MFDFAESRMGNISLSDGKLVFAEEKDLEIFRTLAAQIRTAAEQEDTLIKKNIERQNKFSQYFSSTQASPAPLENANMKEDDTPKREAKGESITGSTIQMNEYIYRISAKIKNHINNQPCLALKNPELIFELTLLPNGLLLREPQLLNSSGSNQCDRAIEQAIRRAEPLPIPADIELFKSFRELRLKFYPKEDNLIQRAEPGANIAQGQTLPNDDNINLLPAAPNLTNTQNKYSIENKLKNRLDKR